MDLLSLSAVLLLPLIPTLIIYLFIKDRRSRAEARGEAFGVKFQAGGAIASYVIFCLLAFLAVRLIEGNGVATVDFRLHPRSSSDKGLIDFLQHHASSVELLLEREGSDPLSIRNFEVSSGNVLVAENLNVARGSLGKKFKVSIRPVARFASIKPELLQLKTQNDFDVELSARPEKQDWITALDLKTVLFYDGGTKLRLREVFVLRNDGPASLESALFNGYAGTGDIMAMEVSARQMSAADLGALSRRWSRDELQGQGVEQILERFDREWTEAMQAGREIGFRRLVNQDFAELVQKPRVERGQLRVDNTSPVVGPVGGGVPPNEGVVVTVEIESLYGSSPLRSGDDDHLGTLFERPCERALLIAHTDGSLGIDGSRTRLEFKEKASQLVASLGNPVQRTSDTAVSVDLAGVGAADVARMYWVWR